MPEYKSKDFRVFYVKRLAELNGDQYKIWDYSLHGKEACAAKGTGIYTISTCDFKLVPQKVVQDELGRTDKEVSLELYNQTNHPLSNQEKQRKFGRMARDFPDIIEYDPRHDIIFSKLMFEYSTLEYLTTSAKRIEGIVWDYEKYSPISEERWWGEFMTRNHDRIHAAWKEYFPLLDKKRKNEFHILPAEKVMQHLFELERKFSPSMVPSPDVSQEKVEKLIQELSKQI